MIKDKLIKLFLPRNIINLILNGKYPLQLKITIFVMDIFRIFRFYFIYGGKFKGLSNIEGIKEYNISKSSFNGKNKKEGISAYSRLKNAGDFIIPTIESAIEYFDEFILVENGSTDDTIEKCEYLQKKYPNKIKFYRYEPVVYPLFSKEFKSCSENSVHNFAYMSNYTLSKVSYKYALKIDDDQIFIYENIVKFLEDIKKKGLNSFMLTPLINIQKYNGELLVGKDNYKSTFSGLFSDIGIHPVSNNIYFHSNGITEGYVYNYFSKLGPITFLHLKLLKPGKGLDNYHKNGHNYLKDFYKSEEFINLEEKYKILLKKYIKGE